MGEAHTGPVEETWATLRREYADAGLREDDLTPQPLTLFHRWLGEAVAARLPEPNAMVVATVDEAGHPSSRMVLLKGVDQWGFRFYTNLSSRKGGELDANPACALLFPWHGLERQVRVEGAASRLLREDVAAYWAARPRGSQLGAWSSHQSSVVRDRAELEDAYAAAEARFPDSADVPLPQEWGGFVVRPEVIEFWQGRRDRMHDRLRYRRTADGGWLTERLAP